jgi:hypothetical protein
MANKLGAYQTLQKDQRSHYREMFRDPSRVNSATFFKNLGTRIFSNAGFKFASLIPYKVYGSMAASIYKAGTTKDKG